MTVDPATDRILPAPRKGAPSHPDGPRVVGLEDYCRLLLAHRALDRIEHGLPSGYRGLRDPRTGQAWLIREDTLPTAG